MSIRVEHSGITDLASDLRKIETQAPRDMKQVVRRAGPVGADLARTHAKRTAGKHGKLYPKSITWETSSFVGFGGGSYSVEWGPQVGRKQGSMSFEEGSRNQPPHRDLAYSAGIMGPAFVGEVRRLPDGWFWPL